MKQVGAATEDEMLFVCQTLGYIPTFQVRGVAQRGEDGTLEACILYDTWTENSVQVHSYIREGCRPSRLWLREIFRFPFENGRDLIIGLTPSYNEKALRFNKHIGFTVKYVQKDGFAKGVDNVLQEIRESECKWYKRTSQ